MASEKLIGLELKIARIRAGMKQQDLANRIGCTQAMVSFLERGIRKPGEKLSKKIEEALLRRAS
jgi:transcriptional regulator with XRE-family HTH domain